MTILVNNFLNNVIDLQGRKKKKQSIMFAEILSSGNALVLALRMHHTSRRIMIHTKNLAIMYI
jgi:hypothetical protein